MEIKLFAFLVLICMSQNLVDSFKRDDGLIEVGFTSDKVFYTGGTAGNLSWMQAQEYCHQLTSVSNAKLANLENLDEELIAIQYLSENGDTTNGPAQFWLSATDFESEGEFRWTKSGNLAVLSNRIVQAEADALEHNCLKLQLDGKYYDESCAKISHNLIWALCEVARSGTEPTTPEQPQPSTTMGPTMQPSTTMGPTMQPSTTVSPTAQPSTSSTSSPQPFECTAEGSFPDPLRCNVYHVCIRHQGSYIDYEMTCPAFTNYCPKEQVCGDVDFCPCSLEGNQDTEEDLVIPQSSRNLSFHTVPSIKAEEVIYLGNYNGKSLFTMQIGNLNWIQSMELCHSHGYMLARLESEEERSRLIEFLELNYYADYFWLSGVDYGGEGDYYWFGNGGSIHYPIYGNGGKENNCMYLCGCGPIYDWSCEYHKYNTLWPLCQKTNQ